MEILLTIMQSVVAVLLLANMRFEWWNASLLFLLWLVQFLRATWREEITMVYAAWAVGLVIWFVMRPPAAPRIFFKMMRDHSRKGATQ